ncbi:MAG TPA: flagellar basal-body MS-ring/collar protein FliF [Terracidiphilus sp.]|nr:flagellar basal-body MS-ring/collar protein FliF [Terracidiphilus sp.]
MAGFNNLIDQAKNFWASRNGRQRGFLLGGGVATVVLLAVFVRLLGTPDYKPLFTDLEPADAQTLAAQLDAQHIPHQVSSDGKTISVPADKLDAARLQTASQGQPHSGRMGFEIFDKMSWGQTEFDEKVAYQRALEGELERTIKTLSDVDSARVHLVMPTESVFLDHQRDAKASVILKLHRSGISKDAVLAISRLVSGAVDGLKPEDVSIIDADSDRSLGVGHDGMDNAGEGEEAKLTERLISTLQPVVGTDKIRATVNIDYDQASSEESQEKYDPSVSALLSDQKSEDEAGGGMAAGGVPGTASNVPVSKEAKRAAAQATPNASQSSRTESAQYGVNKTVLHTITPAGRIERVSAALLVDDAVVRSERNGKVTFTKQKRSQAEMEEIRELAEAAIGFDAKRGDTLSVQNMSFDGNAAEAELPAANWATQVQKTVSDYSSIFRPLSLLVLFILAYLFVLRPVQKHALSAADPLAQPALAGGKTPSLSIGAGGAGDDSLRATQLKEQAIELIKQKPLVSARAMQTWMSEEPS